MKPFSNYKKELYNSKKKKNSTKQNHTKKLKIDPLIVLMETSPLSPFCSLPIWYLLLSKDLKSRESFVFTGNEISRDKNNINQDQIKQKINVFIQWI